VKRYPAPALPLARKIIKGHIHIKIGVVLAREMSTFHPNATFVVEQNTAARLALCVTSNWMRQSARREIRRSRGAVRFLFAFSDISASQCRGYHGNVRK
jgi:hypothetical protein